MCAEVAAQQEVTKHSHSRAARALGWADNTINKTCTWRRRWRLLRVHSEASDKGAEAPDVVAEWPSMPFKRFNIVFSLVF